MKKLLLSCVVIFLSLFCLSNTANAAVLAGNQNGNITLVFIYDYQCPICHEMYPMIEPLIHKFPNLKVRMMPVAVKNMTSLYEAAAAIAATPLGGFQTFSDQVMARPPMTNDQVTALLNQLGLNSQEYQNAMHSQMVKQQLLEGQKLMDEKQQTGVPVFVIYPTAEGPDGRNAVVVPGRQSFETLASAIQMVGQKTLLINNQSVKIKKQGVTS